MNNPTLPKGEGGNVILLRNVTVVQKVCILLVVYQHTLKIVIPLQLHNFLGLNTAKVVPFYVYRHHVAYEVPSLIVCLILALSYRDGNLERPLISCAEIAQTKGKKK